MPRTGRPPVDPEIRFMRFVNKLPNGCWEWTGTIDKYGYGTFWDGTKKVTAHTWAYRHWKGEPVGQIDHTCHDRTCAARGPECPHRCCVNPDDLEDTTPRENTLRSGASPAYNALKEKCHQGHEFTHVNSQGARSCATCLREASARFRAANRERLNAEKRARRAARTPAPAAPSGSPPRQ